LLPLLRPFLRLLLYLLLRLGLLALLLLLRLLLWSTLLACLRGRLAVIPGHAVHLHELLSGDLVAQALHDLLLGELLDLHAPGGAGYEVHLCHLEQLPEDQLPSAVPVHEGGDDPLLAQVHHRLGNVGALHGDGVLNARLEEVQNVRSALDHDDGVAVGDVRSRGEALLAVVDDLLGLYALANALGEVDAGGLGLLDELGEKLPCPLDYLGPLGDADILDAEYVDLGLARPHPVDGLQCRGQDDGLHLV